MARSTSQFQTIRSEGALLPPDVLRAIASQKVEGTSPESYHLPPGTKLNEAIAHSWSVLQKHWKAFQEFRCRLPQQETGTEATNQNWLLPLFEELKYGRMVTTKAPEIDGRTYPVERFYGQAPIHLFGCNLPLDRRTKGARGAATASPHSMMQEFLNRSEGSLWGFFSNGLVLRILRDNVSLSRQAYVEFDLEAMMEGEVYADFALLWMLCHQSRVEGDKPQEFWLEKWSQLAHEQGTRVLSDLRSGVAKAIEALGRGFLAHPRNDWLRQQLQDGQLDKQEYYRQVVRIVYRLLFLFVAEDRGLLHGPDADPAACDLYDTHYSTRRLRELADQIRGSKHADLWHSLSLVFDALGRPEGCPHLGLPALGSFFWRRSSTRALLGPAHKGAEAVEHPVLISNDDLLAAVRELAFVEQDKARRSVDYRNLGSEELGSVYESLLELHPAVNIPGRTFELDVAAGHERKTTGSYYTPDSLVQCLLDSALEPVVAERIQGQKADEATRALLDLKVCDPACGSGHFLIAAAHRLARHLARIRSGEAEPGPGDYQHALRDIIGHCIYGVDINPMAVELCKVSLWLEALEPGKPLAFLDHHVQCGNSLMGATPRLMSAGIPDDAFKAIEGDDKTVCQELKADNGRERKDYERGYRDFHVPYLLGNLPARFANLTTKADETVNDVAAKEDRYVELVRDADYVNARLLADTWCSTFVWVKDQTDLGRQCPTERLFRRVEGSPHSLTPDVRQEIERLRDEYGFLHWHLAFPDVFRLPAEGQKPEVSESGWNGGFDIVLGNPPWDTLSPDQREFFGAWVEGLRSMSPAEQQTQIDGLLEDSSIADTWKLHCRHLFSFVHFLKRSSVFTLYAPGNLGKGDFNVYRMFVEMALRRLRDGGCVGMVVPGGFYGGANASAIRKHVLDECRLLHLYGLINTKRGWFEEVDIDRFAAFAAKRGGRTCTFLVQFGLAGPSDLATPPVDVDSEVIRQLAPDTYAIPDVRDLSQLITSQKMYSACPALGDTSLGPPIRHYSRELDMGNDRGLFTSELAGLPVYEGRMIDHFDHRAKTYVSGHGNSAVWVEREFGDPAKAIVPQWRVLRKDVPPKLGDRCDRFRIAFGDVANPRNERSFMSTIVPPGVICGHTVPTIVFEPAYEWAYLPWLAAANSFTMDALVRRKLSSPHMTFTVLDSLPFPRLAFGDDSVKRLSPLVLRLICTASEMTPFWNRMARLGLVEPVPEESIPPSALLAPADRSVARADVDAYVAKVIFGLTHQELSDVLDSFDVLCRRDEKSYGEFRTKRMVLKSYEDLD
jgi:hypothetical protein